MGLALELTEGRVVETLAWPSGPRRGPEPGSGPSAALELGPGRSGRVRALIEAPLGASLRLQGGGQTVLIPILALIEAPQRTPPQAPVELTVERLPWDAVLLDAGPSDGTVAPGGTVPVAVGYNILTPEPTEIAVRSTVRLRPLRTPEVLWQEERNELVTTNQALPSAQVWSVPAPTIEGIYVLEVETAWEPVPKPESTRLGRWIRWKRNPTAVTSATRRVTLAVLASKPATPSRAALGPVPVPVPLPPEQEVEAIDLARLRSYRPVANGRAPLQVQGAGRDAWPVPEAALVEASRRDRLRGWITRSGTEAASLAPADATGLAWSALGLKVAHPGRPHRLSLAVAGGHPAALGVALIDGPGPGPTHQGRPRVVLDACASGPPIIEGGPPVVFSWLVWPEDPDPVLVMVNRDPTAPVQFGTVTLTELSELAPSPPLVEPEPALRRTLGLYLASPNALDRFGFAGSEEVPGDPLGLARNLAQYVLMCGASAVVLPERLSDRDQRRALDGQAAEDALGPDRLDLLVRVLKRQGCSTWIELALEGEGALPGLPAPGSPEALGRDLTRLDRHGRADADTGSPSYHPLHPEVRAALKRHVVEAITPRPSRPGLAGVLIRLGPGPTLLGGPDTGFDDTTYARFVRETFDPETARNVPGLGDTDPNRFAARAQFLAGSGRMPWLTWRSQGIAALYAELAGAVRQVAPGGLLAVATPSLGDDPAGQVARQVDLAGLPPSHAWRAVGLDLATWPTGEGAAVVLRGAGLSTDPLARDLATSPDLDTLVAARPGRGLLLDVADDPGARPGMPRGPLASSSDPADQNAGANAAAANANGNASLFRDTGLRLSALPLSEGPDGDEPLGHALAGLDARLILLALGAVTGHEARVRQFARVFRTLPAAPAGATALDRQPFGVAVRTFPLGEQTYLGLANDTPYPVRLDTLVSAPGAAVVDDLGRGLRLKPETTPEGRHVVLDLLPFGVASLRIAAPRVRVAAVTPYPSEAVKASMLVRYNELSEQLSRLNRNPGDSRTGPPNPGFEPSFASSAARGVELTVAHPGGAPAGWQLVGKPANTMEIDPAQFHSGRGSLRLSAPAPPAAIVSDRFVPDVRSSLTIQAWLRSDHPDARVRVWIEGESAGQPFVRRSELMVPPEWSAMAVRTTEIPAAGLSRAQIRFELLTAGRLWVDDLVLAGDALSETEKLNATRALLAALHAYRDQHYADFARLAGSHWARLPAVVGVAGADGRGADRPGMIRTGGATALPPDRRLR
jgi:hypothetical protein